MTDFSSFENWAWQVELFLKNGKEPFFLRSVLHLDLRLFCMMMFTHLFPSFSLTCKRIIPAKNIYSRSVHETSLLYCHTTNLVLEIYLRCLRCCYHSIGNHSCWVGEYAKTGLTKNGENRAYIALNWVITNITNVTCYTISS